jgi:cyclin-dependent kinase regulatory subunit CKS1
MPQHITYSNKYKDDTYEYRHVILTADIALVVPKGRLLTEAECKGIGVQQSRGWIHYAIHHPEPHILLFRRALSE